MFIFYLQDTLEIQVDAIRPGSCVILFDDLLATGGTLSACVHLVKMCNVSDIDAVVFMELTGLPGRLKMDQLKIPTYSLIKNS